jgi:hypothetical protein
LVILGNIEGKAVSFYTTEAYGEVEGQLQLFVIPKLNDQLHDSAVYTREKGPKAPFKQEIRWAHKQD